MILPLVCCYNLTTPNTESKSMLVGFVCRITRCHVIAQCAYKSLFSCSHTFSSNFVVLQISIQDTAGCPVHPGVYASPPISYPTSLPDCPFESSLANCSQGVSRDVNHLFTHSLMIFLTLPIELISSWDMWCQRKPPSIIWGSTHSTWSRGRWNGTAVTSHDCWLY